jgi:hypothetical protein
MKLRRNVSKFTASCIGIVGLAGACLFSNVTVADGSAAASTPSPGTWQSHKYSFQFLGFTSTYSCDGLADKLKVLLLAAGARADVKSQPGACAAPFGRPDKFARADLTFYTLAPLGANPTADGKTVNGIWRAVAFGNRSPRELAVGDCELVEQFKTQVLPMFSTRNVVSNTTCIPYQESGSNIDLRFDAFSASPKQPAVAAQATPAQIFMYPKNGQSEAQQAADRRECEQWATQQTGGAASNTSNYQRAMAACASARGYSVQ